MAFCTNCGAQISGDTKFCPSCGAKLAAAAQQPGQEASRQQTNEPPRQGYTPPQQQGYTPPQQQSYTPPQQQSYTPPQQQGYTPPQQQGYTPPQQQSYTPPQQSYTPPQQGYTPPQQQTYQAQPGGGAAYAPVAPAHGAKKPLNKKLLFIIGGAVLAVIIALVLIFTLGSKGGTDVTGKYIAVSATVGGEPATLDGEWIELKKGGKGTFYMGYEFDLKWKLDGENFTGSVSFMGFGDDCTGTLKDDVLTVTYGDYTYTMIKEGSNAAMPEGEGALSNPGPAGFYSVFSMSVAGQELSRADMEAADMANDTYLQLNADGTGTLALSGETPDSITYDLTSGMITYGTGETATLTVDGDTVSVYFETQDMKIVFVRDDNAEAPAADGSGGAFVSPTTEITIPSLWYGTARFFDFTGSNSDEKVEDIWGKIDYDTNGQPYFELYEVPLDQRDSDTDAVVSMYIIEDPQQLIPDIGNEDAWLIDIYLTADDADAYTVSLQNGALDIVVPYTGSSGSCTCEFFIRVDGTPWDEANDPLPPGYDDYKTSLPEASAGGSSATALLPGEPSSTGDGQASKEAVYRTFKWLWDMDYEYKEKNCTYEFVRDYIGVDGFDCGNTDPGNTSDPGDHYFDWYISDVQYIHVGFRQGDDGRWICSGLNSSGFVYDDVKDIPVTYD